MKIEDLVVINKKDLEAKIKEIETEYFKLKKGNYSNTDYFDGARTYLKYVYNDISKPLKGFIEDAFNESRRQHSWAGGHIYGLSEEEDLTDFKFYNKEEYLKQIKW